MNQKQYLRRISKSLPVSRGKKREILRDLEEAFASAAENGETEAQLMERLGTPEELIRTLGEELGFDPSKSKRRRRTICAAGAFSVAALSLLLCWGSYAARGPENVIGRADSMTSIQVEASFALDPGRLFLIVGVIALLLGGIQTVHLCKKI